MRPFGTRAVAAVTAGLMTFAISSAPALAVEYEPTVGDQTGTGQTDLTMVIGTGRQSFAGGGSVENPDDDGDGLGDNMAFTVPSSINYVVRADGTLLGPSEGVAHIDNESVFPIEVDSVLFRSEVDFNIVPDASASSRVNSVDLQVGPAQDMLQMSDYTHKRNVGDPARWRMSAKGTGNGASVPLKSVGDVSHLDVDVTSRTSFGRIQWYVSPAYGLSQGITVNYELTDMSTDQVLSGQTTLYKLHENEPLVNDILPQVEAGRMFRLYTMEHEGRTYSGHTWNGMSPTSVGPGEEPTYLDVSSLDGETIMVRGSFSSAPEPTTYEQGITVNYEATDTRTGEVTRGRRVIYDLFEYESVLSTLVPDADTMAVGSLVGMPSVCLTYDGTDYEGLYWNDMYSESDEHLDLSEIEGKTVDVVISFTSMVPPVEYTQGVTVQYEIENATTHEVLTGETVLDGINRF